MDEEYDVVICGTGLTECILSGLLSQEKMKVLHIDRNAYYGGQGASLNLTAMWNKFRQGAEYPKQYGANRDWNIDLIPKFVMANGNLVKILLKTRVSRYLQWQCIDGTYVYQYQKGLFSNKGEIFKVPATDTEALKSDLMSIFQKRKFKNFLIYVQNYDQKNPKTYDGQQYQDILNFFAKGLDLSKAQFSQVLKKFDLGENTIDFVGHAVALYTNDDFMQYPALDVVEKIKMYMNSIHLYGDSPFIYPLYGLGGIPEGFSRMCAIYGGTFMLNTDINKMVFDENGKVCGVESEGKVAKCKMVICDPSYCAKTGQEKLVRPVGRVIRSICIMNHPIPHTKDIPSVQIIIPQKQVKRKNDIYIAMVSSMHQICQKGYYVAIISTQVETTEPEKEIQFAYDLIGPVLEKFVTVSDLYAPVSKDFSNNVIITDSLDELSHFETATKNVLELYKKITGKELDLENLPKDDDE